MSREAHVQFCESLGVRFPGATHPEIEVQPSPTVPLRPHNGACEVKSRRSHIIMMLPGGGTSCWFAISDGHHVSSNCAVAPVVICLKDSPRNCPKAVISGLQRASTFGQRNTFSIGSPIETCRSRRTICTAVPRSLEPMPLSRTSSTTETSPPEVQCRSLVRLFAARWYCPDSNLC